MLTVIGFRLSGAITLDSTRRRNRSANTSPSALPVSGRMNANSSPPTRQGTSPSREADRMSAPRARSTASPFGWPNSSLNFLNPSMSIIRRLNECPNRLDRLISSLTRRSKLRRLPTSVSSSVCDISRRRKLASRSSSTIASDFAPLALSRSSSSSSFCCM